MEIREEMKLLLKQTVVYGLTFFILLLIALPLMVVHNVSDWMMDRVDEVFEKLTVWLDANETKRPTSKSS